MPMNAEDERLAVQALARRQLGLLPPPLPFAVHYANVFSSHPAQLYDDFREEAEGQGDYGGVFFFSHMARRSRQGPSLSSSSSSRSNNPGQWKSATGNATIYGGQGGGIGGRMTLLHYGGRVGRSCWAMDVYSARPGVNNQLRDSDLCLCRVYWTGLGPPPAPSQTMAAAREAPLAGAFGSMYVLYRARRSPERSAACTCSIGT